MGTVIGAIVEVVVEEGSRKLGAALCVSDNLEVYINGGFDCCMSGKPEARPGPHGLYQVCEYRGI